MNRALRDLLQQTHSWADPSLARELEGYAEITGADPVFATPFRVGEAAAGALAAKAAAIAHIWKLRNGRSQKASVAVKEAALSLLSVGFLRQNGYTLGWGEPTYPTVDFYRAGDGRWIFLHGAYPLLLEEERGPYGRLIHLCAADRYSETPPRFARPPAPQGADDCEWP